MPPEPIILKEIYVFSVSKSQLFLRKYWFSVAGTNYSQGIVYFQIPESVILMELICCPSDDKAVLRKY